MDVPRGCCWRCEAPKTGVSCKKCGIAQYCREKCCTEDIERHRPQCEVWTPKTCSNHSCNNTENLKECSNCHDASYCSTTCQRQHWASHKRNCKERVEKIKLVSESLEGKFASRVAMPQYLETTYYFGNVIAQDLLNLQEEEMTGTTEADDGMVMKDFSILSAGCGNLRNLICTITSLPRQFGGKLRVTMNDIDPFVQARNLLFLFMMCHFSSDPNIAPIVTTIWYSLHLPEATFKLLIDSLHILVSITSSKLIEYCYNSILITDEDLEMLKQVWQGWLTAGQHFLGSVPLSIQRKQIMFKNDFKKAADGLNCYLEQVSKRHRKSFGSWVHNGDFLPSGKIVKTRYENPTLTGRISTETIRGEIAPRRSPDEIAARSKRQPKDEEFLYCISAELMPFGEWDYLQASKVSNDDSLIVMYHSFISNQIKQVVEFIKVSRLHLRILLGTCAELTEDKVHGKRFDRIFTSNISDYVGTKTLLKVMKPLLNTENKNAVIVTQYWNWYQYFKESLVGHPMYQINGIGIVQKWIAAAQIDTGLDLSLSSQHWFQEYFNNTSYFVDYLRSDLRACNRMYEEVENASVKVETYEQVKNQCSGLRMRDFRHGVNKVAPWRYRCNVRPVNMLPALSRMVEWYIPQ